jgi:erythromycin esterase-like protein
MRTFTPQIAPGTGRSVGYGDRMNDSERDRAVADHLAALDDEIARLRKAEAALDRRLAAAEDERRALADETQRRVEDATD